MPNENPKDPYVTVSMLNKALNKLAADISDMFAKQVHHMDARFEQVNAHFDRIEARLDSVEAKIDDLKEDNVVRDVRIERFDLWRKRQHTTS